MALGIDSKILLRFLLVVLLTIGLIKAELRLDQQWTGGFKGAIEIPITNSINNGWTLEIEFDRSVTIDVRLLLLFFFYLIELLKFFRLGSAIYNRKATIESFVT